MATETFTRSNLSVLRHARLCLGRTLAAPSLAYLLLVTSLQPAQGQQVITVRFVDSKSGKPIRNFYLSVEAWSGNWTGTKTEDMTFVTKGYEKAHDGTVTIRLPARPSETATAVFTVSTKADREGKVIIHFPETAPEHIRVFSGELAMPFADFSPAAVLESGVVAPFSEDKTNTKVKVLSKPGEIVVLNKRVTAWDRMLQEIP